MASAQGLQFTGGHEGFVSSWYLDPTGTPTIGYGFTWGSRIFREWWMGRYGRKMKRGDKMSKEDGFTVLKLLVETEYEPPVKRKFPGQPQHRIDAGTDTTFNCGPGALNWDWAVALVRGDVKTSAAKLRVTATTSKGQRLPGLVRRRKEAGDILEFNKWPAWLTNVSVVTPPETRIDKDDIEQGQRWLNELGYNCGEPDGVPGPNTIRATRTFQQDHGNLLVDGIMGRATLNALQRAVDLKNAAVKTTAGSGTIVVAGGGEQAAGPGVDQVTGFDFGPWLIWGGIGLFVVIIVILSWRYRDEINNLVRKL